MPQGDLFDNLPDPSTEHPTVDQTPPVPGSRRAAREAAQRNGDPVETAPVDDAPVEPVNAPATGALDDLFAPDADEERPVRKRKRRKGCLIALIIILVLIGGAVTAGVWAMNTYGDKINELMGWGEPKDYEAGQEGDEVFVTISEGDTGNAISTTLYESGVTKTKEAFYEYLIAEGENPTFYPGVFSLREQMTSAAALAALSDESNRVENSVTIPEGYTAAQAITAIAAATGISEDELNAAAADFTQFGVPAEAPSIEGFLFPATYTFDPDATAVSALQRLVDETFSRLDKLGVAEEDRYDVLTLAALIQKESGPSTEDMRKISRVFLNRIDDGMLLQSDATVAYGAGSSGTVWTTPEQRGDESNIYNTYVHLGLPAGPISLPGEDAIEAATNPADGTWLYFVAVDLRTGETIFSNTYAEHLVAVKQMQNWCKVEENKPYCA